jgi:hypothetical protein
MVFDSVRVVTDPTLSNANKVVGGNNLVVNSGMGFAKMLDIAKLHCSQMGKEGQSIMRLSYVPNPFISCR